MINPTLVASWLLEMLKLSDDPDIPGFQLSFEQDTHHNYHLSLDVRTKGTLCSSSVTISRRDIINNNEPLIGVEFVRTIQKVKHAIELRNCEGKGGDVAEGSGQGDGLTPTVNEPPSGDSRLLDRPTSGE